MKPPIALVFLLATSALWSQQLQFYSSKSSGLLAAVPAQLDPIKVERIATNPPAFTVGPIQLGDDMSKHANHLELSPTDSQLSGFEATYHLKSPTVSKILAGIQFDLIQFGITDGKIAKIYAWSSIRESQTAKLMAKGSAQLEEMYGDSADKAKSKDVTTTRIVIRQWEPKGFQLRLRTFIHGEYKPFTDRYANIELTVTPPSGH